MGVLSWGGRVSPKFSAPHSGETMRQTTKVFETQERARGPLSPCQVWCGSDFTRRRGGQKRWVFYLSVCLFVTNSMKWGTNSANFVKIAQGTPLWGVYISHFGQIWVQISIFGVLHPRGCTDGGEIWHGGVNLRSPPPCQISPPSVQRVAPKNLKIGLWE